MYNQYIKMLKSLGSIPSTTERKEKEEREGGREKGKEERKNFISSGPKYYL